MGGSVVRRMNCGWMKESVEAGKRSGDGDNRRSYNKRRARRALRLQP